MNEDVEIKQSGAKENYYKIVFLRRNISKNFWELIGRLKSVRRDKQWEELKYKSWADFLKQPEIDFSESTVNNYITIYNKLEDLGLLLHPDVANDLIKYIDISKLLILVPELTKDNAKDLLGKAKKMTRKRLKKHIKDKKRDKEAEEAKVLPDITEVELINDDFMSVDIEENSIDLIITDPPYPEEYLPLWKELAEFSAKVLKPSGFLVAYSGQLYIKDILNYLSEKLCYYWTFCLQLPGQTAIVSKTNIMNGWKPIFIYQKKPFKKIETTLYDVVKSDRSEKKLHEWQQSESGVRDLIKNFSKEGDVVMDPFAGTGTFPLVAHQMGRKATGIEIDETTYQLAKKRIYDTLGSDRKKKP